jgi:septal ring factor EnvC (AmiA/AmiB activator)
MSAAELLGPGWMWKQAWPPTLAVCVPPHLVENFEDLEVTGTVVSMTDAKIAQLEKRIEALEAENAELRAEIERLSEENIQLRGHLHRAEESLRTNQHDNHTVVGPVNKRE